MKHLMEDIAQLQHAFGHPVNDEPVEHYELDRQRMAMRLRTIGEEYFELLETAYPEGVMKHVVAANKVKLETMLVSTPDPSTFDLEKAGDALVDMMVFIVGTGLEWGIPLDRLWAAVHRANMAKVGPDGKVTYREDGKVLKPEGWKPPDIAAAMREKTEAKLK